MPTKPDQIWLCPICGVLCAAQLSPLIVFHPVNTCTLIVPVRASDAKILFTAGVRTPEAITENLK